MAFAESGARTQRLLAVLAIVLPGMAYAQTPAPPLIGLPPPDFKAEASLNAALAELDRSATTVVAEVGSRAITRGDVADAIRAMPRIVSAIPLQQLYQSAAGQVMEQEALALIGTQAGLDKDPVVQRRMKNAADQALAGEVLRRSLAPNITDKALHAVYDALVANKPGPDEVQARIIMVNTKDEAATLIQRLQGGADFAALARDFSKDGTAASGGDLGFARLDMLAPEIGSVAFALAPGQITSFPVRCNNSWFIIKVEGRRQVAAPSFEAARDALEQDVIHAGVPALTRLALQPGLVKFHDLTGQVASGQAPK
jgi:peptidyl-prolyl cis-trans isomerase C